MIREIREKKIKESYEIICENIPKREIKTNFVMINVDETFTKIHIDFSIDFLPLGIDFRCLNPFRQFI